MIIDYCPSPCADCDDSLPALPSAAACEEINTSLIEEIYIAKKGAAVFTDWTDDSEWTARLSQTDAGADKIRLFQSYKATKPEVEPQFRTSQSGGKYAAPVGRTIDAYDDDASVEKHTWHKNMNGCDGGRQVRVWFKAGKYLYGGNKGIIAVWSSYHGITDSTDKPTEGWRIKLSYDAKCEPDKCISPI